MSEEMVRHGVDVAVLVVELAGAIVIGVGATIAFVLFLKSLVQREVRAFVRVRLLFGRFLVLGLEFQLAGDVLRTAVAPSFEEIGQLAAIAAIRTALNYFLGREISEERREVEEADAAEAPSPQAPAHGESGRGA